MANETRLKLFKALQDANYNIGSYEDFDRRMNNADDRRKFYDAVSSEYNIGSFEDFDNRIKESKYNLIIGGKKTPVSEAEYKRYTDTHKKSATTTGTATDSNWRDVAASGGFNVDAKSMPQADFSGSEMVKRGKHPIMSQPKINQQAEEMQKAPTSEQEDGFETYIDKNGEMQTEYVGTEGSQYRRMHDYKAEQERRMANRSFEEETDDLYNKVSSKASSYGNADISDYYKNTPVMSGTIGMPQIQPSYRTRVMNTALAQLDEVRYLRENASRYEQEPDATKRFASDFGHSFINSATDLSTWDFGMTDLSQAATIKSVLDKFDQNANSLNEDEKQLLDAVIINTAAKAYYGDKQGIGTTVGATSAEMIPFMIELFVNPASSFGSASGKKLAGQIAKYAKKMLTRGAIRNGIKSLAKAEGRKVALKTLWNGVKQFSKQFAKDTATGIVMATTTGAAKTASNIIERTNGELYDDGNGNIVHGEGESLPTAIYKGVVGQSLEYSSELAGDHWLGDLAEGVGKLLGKAGGKLVNADNILSKWLKKGVDVGRRIANTDTYKVLSNVYNAGHYNGAMTEYLEEVWNNTENALFNIDMNFGTGENGVFNFEQNWATFLGVAVPGVFKGAISSAHYAVNKTKALAKLHSKEDLGSKVFADRWDDVKKTLDAIPLDDIDNAVSTATSFMRDMDEAERYAVTEYVNARFFNAAVDKVGEVAEEVAESEIEETLDFAEEVAESGDDATIHEAVVTGYASDLDDSIKSTIDRMVADGAGIGEIASVFSGLDDETRGKAQVYLASASMRKNMDERVENEVQSAVEEERKVAESFVDDEGCIRFVALKDTGEIVALTGYEGYNYAIVHRDGRKEIVNYGAFEKEGDGSADIKDYGFHNSIDEYLDSFAEDLRGKLTEKYSNAVEHNSKTNLSPKVNDVVMGLNGDAPAEFIIMGETNDGKFNVVRLVPQMVDGEIHSVPSTKEEDAQILSTTAIISMQDMYYDRDIVAETQTDSEGGEKSAESAEIPAENGKNGENEGVEGGKSAEKSAENPSIEGENGEIAPNTDNSAVNNIAVNEEGEPIFDGASEEDIANYFSSNFDTEGGSEFIQSYVDANREIVDDLNANKPKGKPMPKASDFAGKPNAYIRAKKQVEEENKAELAEWQSKVDSAQAELDKWVSVKNRWQQSQADKASDAHSLEVFNNEKATLADKENALGDAQSLEEYIMREVYKYRYLWRDKGETKGLASHCFGKDDAEERGKRLAYLSNTSGVTLETAAHLIAQSARGSGLFGQDIDEQDVLDTLIATVQRYENRGKVLDAVAEVRAKQEQATAEAFAQGAELEEEDEFADVQGSAVFEYAVEEFDEEGVPEVAYSEYEDYINEILNSLDADTQQALDELTEEEINNNTNNDETRENSETDSVQGVAEQAEHEQGSTNGISVGEGQQGADSGNGAESEQSEETADVSGEDAGDVLEQGSEEVGDTPADNGNVDASADHVNYPKSGDEWENDEYKLVVRFTEQKAKAVKVYYSVINKKDGRTLSISPAKYTNSSEDIPAKFSFENMLNSKGYKYIGNSNKEDVVENGTTKETSDETPAETESASPANHDTHGFKVGDKLMYKGKEATIYDFDEVTGCPVLDTGLAPVMYEVGNWEDISRIEDKEETPIERTLTHEEIDAADVDESVKTLAKAYLNGDTGMLNTIAYNGLLAQIKGESAVSAPTSAEPTPTERVKAVVKRKLNIKNTEESKKVTRKQKDDAKSDKKKAIADALKADLAELKDIAKDIASPKAVQGRLFVALPGLNPSQLEAVFKAIPVIFRIGGKLVQLGVVEYKEWSANMREQLQPIIGKVLGREWLNATIKDAWDSPYKIGDKTMKVSEWAKEMQDAQSEVSKEQEVRNQKWLDEHIANGSRFVYYYTETGRKQYSVQDETSSAIINKAQYDYALAHGGKGMSDAEIKDREDENEFNQLNKWYVSAYPHREIDEVISAIENTKETGARKELVQQNLPKVKRLKELFEGARKRLDRLTSDGKAYENVDAQSKMTKNGGKSEEAPKAKNYRYSVNIGEGGATIHREEVMDNGYAIGDGRWEIHAKDAEELLAIIHNNGMDAILDMPTATFKTLRSEINYKADKYKEKKAKKEESKPKTTSVKEKEIFTSKNPNHKGMTFYAKVVDTESGLIQAENENDIMDTNPYYVKFEDVDLVIGYAQGSKMVRYDEPRVENADAQPKETEKASEEKPKTKDGWLRKIHDVYKELCAKYGVPDDPIFEDSYRFDYRITKGYRLDQFEPYYESYKKKLDEAVEPATEKQLAFIKKLAEESEWKMLEKCNLNKISASYVITILKASEAAITSRMATADEFEYYANELEKVAKLNGYVEEHTESEGNNADNVVTLSAEREKFVNRVKDEMLSALSSGNKPFRSIVDARKMAQICGMDVDMDGKDDILIQELIETGLVNAAKSLIGGVQKESDVFTKETYDDVCALYDMQPTIGMRDSNRIKMQQYSTPLPMSFMADFFAFGSNADAKRVLEPTAGNGMLVSFIPSSRIDVNELDKTRLDNLKSQGFRSVGNNDATEEGVFPSKEYDAVIANPPFGNASAKSYDGTMIAGLDPQITLNALSAMKDDGKAAIIIGGNLEYANNGSIKGKKAFFAYLYDHYNVKGIVDMSGDLYKKHGTTYPTMMILIDGRRSEEDRAQSVVYPPVKSESCGVANTFEELYDMVNQLLNNKEKTNGKEFVRSQELQFLPDNEQQSGQGDRTTDSNEHSSNDGERGGVRGQKLEKSEDAGTAGVRGTSGRNQRTSGVERETPQGRSKQSGKSEGRTRRNDVERVSGMGNANTRNGLEEKTPSKTEVKYTTPAESVKERVVEKSENNSEQRQLDQEKLPYRHHSGGFSLQSVAPASMVESMDATLKMIEERNGVSIDEFVRDELGYDTTEQLHNALAAEQIDSVAMAISQMKNGQSLIIGDQTGVGKGRQMAALIRWASKQGKKPIFITQKADLFTDIYRDLVDVGSGDLRPFIFNSATGENPGVMVDSNGNVVYKALSDKKQAEIFASGELPDEFDFAVLTYSQVNTGDAISQEEADKASKANKDDSGRSRGAKKSKRIADGKPTPKATFLRALAKDNYMFLDESHTAAGSSATGSYIQSILNTSKACTFASATFAKRPDTMPLYALRTAMSKANIAKEELIKVIEKGGVTLQEIMSRALTKAGQMVRRERDMSNVITDWTTITDPKVVSKARKNYDLTIEVFNDIINFQKLYIDPIIEELNAALAAKMGEGKKKKGTDKMGISNTPFASKAYNYTKQLMLALKVDAIIDKVEEEIKAGRHPVIALESTIEANLKEYENGDVVDIPTFAASMVRGLRSTLAYTVKDAKGNEQHYYYNLKQLGEEGERAYHELEEKIKQNTSDIFISPLDAIIEGLRERGYSVGELTGRNFYTERNEKGEVVVRKRTNKDKKRMQREFNNGELDVLILNKSASTGISLHASEKFSDQRQRSMIIAQPLSDINDYMQMIGRIDRTGQVHRGYYINLGLPVPAENRFMMMLSTKLKSLNANTTTAQDSKSNDVEAPDLLNKYGSRCIIEYFRDHVDLYEKLGNPLKLDLDKGSMSEMLEKYKADEDDARKLTGYVALLSTDEQDAFYDDVVQRYENLIKYLNDTGENDLKITTMPLRAKTISKKVSSKGVDPKGDNPFAKDAYVETVEMDVLRKPMKASEVKSVIESLNGGKSASEVEEELVRKINADANEKADKEEARYQEALKKFEATFEKVKAKINANTKMSEEQKAEEIKKQRDEMSEKINSRNAENQRKIESNAISFIQRVRMFSVGETYLMPDNLDVDIFTNSSPAIFCGYKTKDHMTPSTTFAVFAILDGRRRIELPLSQADPLRRISRLSRENYDSTRNTSLDNWDAQIPNETRKTGYILTGNILQAVADTQDKDTGAYVGQLISYTDMDGNIHDGILMPDKWTPKQMKNSGAPIKKAYDKIMSGQMVKSIDGEVTIEYLWRGDYRIRVPKSKKKGGKYYENARILKLVDGGRFYQKNGEFVAEVESDNIKKLLDELSNLGVRIDDEEDADNDKVRFRRSETTEIGTENDVDALIDSMASEGKARVRMYTDSKLVSLRKKIGEAVRSMLHLIDGHARNGVYALMRPLQQIVDNNYSYGWRNDKGWVYSQFYAQRVWQAIEQPLKDYREALVLLAEEYPSFSPAWKAVREHINDVDYALNYYRSAAEGVNVIEEGWEEPRFTRYTDTSNFTHSASQLDQMENEVKAMADALNVPVRVVRTKEEVDALEGLSNRNKEILKGDGEVKGKGLYNTATGEVVVFLPNNEDAQDAIKTVLHEIVGHKGLRNIVGEDAYNDFLWKVYDSMPNEVRSGINNRAVREFGGDVLETLDEYLAEIAEKDETPNWWERVVSAIRGMLRKAGMNLRLSDNDVKYLLWQSKNTLKSGDIVSEAERRVMREKLGINTQHRNAENGGGMLDVDNAQLNNGVRYRKVDDAERIEWFDNQPKVVTYKTVAVDENGELHAPMADNVSVSKSKKSKVKTGNYMFGDVLEAEEHPELVDENGHIKIIREDGKDLNVAYDPYDHSSDSMINDQFKSAWERDNLVVIRQEIAQTDLDEHYHADKAYLPTGLHDWKKGVVGNKLPKKDARHVYLARWSRPQSFVDWQEVADEWIDKCMRNGIDVPFNVVPKAIRDIIADAGVNIIEPEKGMGQNCFDAYEQWKNGRPNNPNGGGRNTTTRKGMVSKEINETTSELHGIIKHLLETIKDWVNGKIAKPIFDRQIAKIEKKLSNIVPVKVFATNVTKKELMDFGYDEDGAEEVISMCERGFGGFYDPAIKKIVIFAQPNAMFKTRQIAELYAHENFHAFLDRLREAGVDVEGELNEVFNDVKARNAYNNVVEGLNKKDKDGNPYYADNQKPEEFLTYIVGYEISKGNIDKVLNILDGVPKEIVKSYLEVIHYGRTEETNGIRLDTASDMRVRRAETEKGAKESNQRKGAVVGTTDSGIDIETKESRSARSMYERMLDNATYKFQEAWQDSMLGLKALMQSIMKAEGKTFDDVLDFENPYWYENHMSSINEKEFKMYRNFLYTPITKAMQALMKSGAKQEDINYYLFAKHGLERNRTMMRSRIDEALEEEFGAQTEKAQKDLNDGKISHDEWEAIMDAIKMQKEDREIELTNRFHKDYSGLTALTGHDKEDSIEDIEADAQALVDAFEGKYGKSEVVSGEKSLTADLWQTINNATNAQLDKQLESGMINKTTYDMLKSRWKYYIPLRGFDETTSDEEYDYLRHSQSPMNDPVRKANGRRSLADDPIATIGNLAESNIMACNRNKLKQMFLLFCENHRSDLVSVNDVHLTNIDGELIAIGPAFMKTTRGLSIEPTLAEFEKWFEEKMQDEPENYMMGKDAPNVPFRVLKQFMGEHQVVVKRGGKQYVLTINSDPRAAQAINGLTNPDGAKDAWRALTTATNLMARLNTTFSPAFVLANLSRDGIFANSLVWAKENPSYAVSFHKNWGKSIKNVGRLAWKFDHGTLDMNEPIEKMFYEFMMNGGETGQTRLTNVEKYKGVMQDAFDKMSRSAWNPKNVTDFVGGALERMNQWAEDTTRFAAYMTSREQGRSIIRSVHDAKDISVNFNKKGAGASTGGEWEEEGNKMHYISSQLAQMVRPYFMFFNAGVQGMYNVGRVAKRNKGKFATITGAYFGLGMLAPFIAAACGGDDGDDDYWNLPEYVRRQNLCIYIGGGYVKIPLPIELRAIYGLGDIAMGQMLGKTRYNAKEIAKQVGEQLGQILPIDFLGEGGMSLVPSVLRPLAETFFTNKDWTGLPIYKDSDFLKNAPNWTKAYSKTDPNLIDFCEYMNEISGGNRHKKGTIDLNPAMIEHLYDGYLGGMGTFLKQNKRFFWDELLGDEEIESRNVPVFNRFYAHADERMPQRRINNEWWRNKELMDRFEAELNGFKKDMTSVDPTISAEGRVKYVELVQSDDFARYQLWKELNKTLDKLDKAQKESGADLTETMYAIKENMNDVMNSNK